MKLSTTISRIVVLVACIGVGGCAEFGIFDAGAPGPGNSSPSANSQVAVRAGISARDARRLAVAYRTTGLRALPPGIARNLARGKPLPPGIARQLVPQGMLSSLPDIANHEWRIAGRDLVLIAIGTLIVVDILNDVFA